MKPSTRAWMIILGSAVAFALAYTLYLYQNGEDVFDFGFFVIFLFTLFPGLMVGGSILLRDKFKKDISFGWFGTAALLLIFFGLLYWQINMSQ